jgi:ketosteroid isomerase-like protein
MSAAEAARSFYELFSAGKIEEALERFVAADAVLENPLPEPIPFGGRFEGRHGFAAYLQAIFSGIEMEQFEVDEIFAEGERVVVLGRETSRVRSTDKRYTMSWVHVLTVRNGRVQHLREYNDTAAMAATFA